MKNTLNTGEFLNLVRLTNDMVVYGQLTKGEASEFLEKTGYRAVAHNTWLSPTGDTVSIEERK